ncbi:MAG: helix-turn-helix transcriptional regulator, partial [Sphaerochaetaceae bacterium]|nr:helix-turn-helix transcriptional regulator [Sphaerochaetaceae bacterium]
KWISSPFIRKEWNRDNMERILASAAMKASMLPSLELYYTSLPLLSSTRMMKLIMAIINSYSPMEEEYDFVPLEEGMALEKRKNQSLDLNADYSFIYRRYDMENRFLRVVKEGNIDELDTSIKDMVDFSQNSDSTLFTGLYRKNISSGMSVLRTLARKAAEDAGVSVITIDIITQRAVQKIDSEMRQSEIIRITKEMIRELTEEVRKENILLKGISPSISRCINHIRLHYAENITLSDLCSISSMSKANLTRRFQKETGTTVFTYIRNARCHHAVALLEEGVLTIKEIAGYVGYPDYNYFSKVFRSYAGVSPVEYRKEHLNRNGR